MVTFLQLKEYICMNLFYCDQQITETNDLELSTSRSRYDKFYLINDELKKYYDLISVSNFNGLELYSETKYEKAIDLDGRAMMQIMREKSIIESNDQDNDIVYSIGLCSFEYCIFLILRALDSKSDLSDLKFRYPRPMPSIVSRIDDERVNIDWKEILKRRLRQCSMRIKTTKSKELYFFQKRKIAFIFEYIYNNKLSMTEPNEIEDFFLTLKRNGSTNKINIDGIAPKREYNSDIVDYYKLAFSSNDPYIQYISFYHIIEFFYDEVFKRKMVKDLTDKITQPDFSYKNEDQVFGLATFIKNRIKMNANEGQGNETESLKYVLKEYINIEELKNRLDKKDLKFYSENIVPFSKGPTISWKDEPGVYTNITKRIYFTRNALIHSKSGKKDKMYKPYRDEMILQKEIPLVRVIAEMIIINSSKVI